MKAIGGGSSESVNGDDDDGRASKKAFNKLPSSMHKVMSNDDLLIEILLLLPIVSLNLFKRVSKHWLSLITSPSFMIRRTQISDFVPPSGLFTLQEAWSSAYNFLSFDSRKKVKRSIVFIPDLETSTKSIIKQSCNGLLLCRDYNNHYYICNPLFSMFKILPPIHPLNSIPSSCFNDFRMAFDPTKSPHYKVVHVGGAQDAADVYGPSITIQTYSSETGVWTVSDDRFPSSSFFGFWNGIYLNGAIHWFSDSNDPFHFKLEIVDRLVLTNIQTPQTLEGEVNDDRKLFGSYGSLLLLCRAHYCSRKLNIYEMKNRCSEWSIKYFVNLDNMLRRTWKLPEDWGCYNIWSIFFGE
ncbi:granule-bound starch synthase [Tanacetum coccineum]|uniref:Granule-bound starch synthase n=1 Tax=Tanacetum coccineum TaxID=301880 RepID=A0ABQ5HJL9_9ASTR